MLIRFLGALVKAFKWPVAAFGGLLLVAFVLIASGKLIVNVTPSLPQTFFWATKLKPDEELKPFDLVGYKPPTGEDVINPFNANFLKYVRGVPGDVITAQETDNATTVFFINGEKIAEAKNADSLGHYLEAGPTGTLTEDNYFVWTPHENSYDSRYKTMGWINRNAMLVRAKPIF